MGVPFLLACSLMVADGRVAAGFLSRQNLLPTAHVISQMLPGHLHLLTSLLLAILYSPRCSRKEHIKAIWSHSFWEPASFLSSPFPGTLILIACFYAVAFFSNLKGPETLLGLCARRRLCLKVTGGALGSTGVMEPLMSSGPCSTST